MEHDENISINFLTCYCASRSMAATSLSTIDRIRSNRFIWGVRFFQIIIALAILGVCASSASAWHDIDCSTPGRLAYHIAAVSKSPSSYLFSYVSLLWQGVLTILSVVFFVLSTGPFEFISWWAYWFQIALDTTFLVIWISAAAVANYTCDGLCSSCNARYQDNGVVLPFIITVGSLKCHCGTLDLDDSGIVTRSGEASGSSRPQGGTSGDLASVAEKATDVAAKQGLDATMM